MTDKSVSALPLPFPQTPNLILFLRAGGGLFGGEQEKDPLSSPTLYSALRGVLGYSLLLQCHLFVWSRLSDNK